MAYEMEVLLEGYQPVTVNKPGDIIVSGFGPRTKPFDPDMPKPTVSPPRFLFRNQELTPLPANFSASTLDDAGVVYGSCDGLFATWKDGELTVSNVCGGVSSANSNGTRVGSMHHKGIHAPAIWEGEKLIWKGSSRGSCVSVNAEGLVGINYWDARLRWRLPVRRSTLWKDGVETPVLGPDGQDYKVCVTLVCDEGVLLGYLHDYSGPKILTATEASYCRGYIWEGNVPRRLPDARNCKGFQPLFRGPYGVIVGRHSIPAELPMCLDSDFQESDCIVLGANTYDLSGEIRGWNYVNDPVGITADGRIICTQNGKNVVSLSRS